MWIQVTSFTPRESDRSGRYRKENAFNSEWVIYDLDTGREILCARFYGKGTVSYCCVWNFSDETFAGYARGAGKAGGYGYHKDSAALDAALKDAGFALSHSIAAVGESAMRSAFEAIAAHRGVVRPLIHVAHP